MQPNFCLNNPLVETIVGKLYDIITKPSIDPHKTWKEKLAEFLILSNKALPHVSNQCNYNSNLRTQETSQQTKITSIAATKNLKGESSHPDLSFDTDGTSVNITTSSCISCSAFGSVVDCMQQALQHQTYEDIIKARTAPLEVKETSSSSKNVFSEEASHKWKIGEDVGEDEMVTLRFEKDESDKDNDKPSTSSAKDLDFYVEHADVENVFEHAPPAEPVTPSKQDDKISVDEPMPRVVSEKPFSNKESIANDETITKKESVVKSEFADKDESIFKNESFIKDKPILKDESAEKAEIILRNESFLEDKSAVKDESFENDESVIKGDYVAEEGSIVKAGFEEKE